MKKKQVGIRIMFIAAATGAVFYGYNTFLNHTVATVEATTKVAVVSNTSEMTGEITNTVSSNLETLLSELNTKVDSIQADNNELRKVIEAQGSEIEKLSGALKKLGITFQ